MATCEARATRARLALEHRLAASLRVPPYIPRKPILLGGQSFSQNRALPSSQSSFGRRDWSCSPRWRGDFDAAFTTIITNVISVNHVRTPHHHE
jgi:hypothetical protein